MIAAKIAMGLLLHQYFRVHTGVILPQYIDITIIAVVCIFVAGLPGNGGPSLGWCGFFCGIPLIMRIQCWTA